MPHVSLLACPLGIGRVITHELCSLGAIVVIAARNKGNLDRVAEEIKATYGTGRCEGRICNVRDEVAVQDLVNGVLATYKKIDGLVRYCSIYAVFVLQIQ